MKAHIFYTICGAVIAFLSSGYARTYADASVREAEATRLHEKHSAQRAAALAWAEAYDQPVRTTVTAPDGAEVTYELVGLDEATGEPLYYMTLNENAAISTAANLVRETAPYNVDGSSVIVGVWDSGAVRPTHQEFGARVTVVDGSANTQHGTHVGGTIGATGVTASARGMVPAARIDSYDWNNAEADMTSRAAAAPNEPGKISISNHSYGIVTGWAWGSWSGNTAWHWFRNISVMYDSGFGRYTTDAREWDAIAYNAPYYLICKAAGNDRNDGPSNGNTVYYWNSGWQSTTYDENTHPSGDGEYKGGYDTIGHRGNAKNILTIGAVNDAVSNGVRQLAFATMSSFSSWGPSDDGRIKPDVVGNGVWVYSTASSADNAYTSLSGTSMASPNVAGSAALLVDLYNTHMITGGMRSSTLKGLIIHTADSLGTPGPDYIYGWGLVNTKDAADTLLAGYNPIDPTATVTEGRLHTGNAEETLYFAASGDEDFVVTLCWTDPPGTARTAHDDRVSVLVNDLDIRVIDMHGTTNYPYVLDVDNPSAPATTGDNVVDNVEQVRVTSPVTEGMYTVHISHKGTLTDSEQHYSLIVTGTIPEPTTGIATVLIAVGFFARRRLA